MDADAGRIQSKSQKPHTDTVAWIVHFGKIYLRAFMLYQWAGSQPDSL
jgi:hypothetical protein